ncbi:c-type cytochrome [Yoonia sediminilitoris]|uniref:Cytochrome c n=1 Tax=Yoonia sediminilitoris TaxID=1286148 RepID=A0A2T6K9M2_9RHOB|nr:c-type cytochrome [Yoonia sediminilitoris]PUB11507.1 cytochrome c [Yoonia sediminilitoris]RCW91707.1 cytochrome c [Yoonia sediminilitoris]
MLRAFGLIMALTLPAQAQDFFTLRGHGGPIMDIAVSPSGQIATASFDNAVGLWDSTTPTWFDGHEAAVNVVTFWNETIALSAGDDFQVRVWPSAQAGRVLGRHQGKVIALATSHVAQRVASASWDGSIGLWPLSADGAAPMDANPVFLRGHRQGVNDVAFTEDGKRLYSASTDGTIRVWDVASGAEVQLLASHGFGVNELILNEAEGWLAYGAVDGSTRFIDPLSGDLIRDFTLERRPILALAYDPSTRQLAVGDGDGYIMMIDTAKMQISRDFRATQQGPIWALAFSPDGQNIHAGGIEDIMYSWPVATMREHGQMAGEPRSFLQDPDTMGNGERQFKRKCSICHTLSETSARRAGPTLQNLFGRRAGTVSDYAYSETLTGSEIVWSDETINDLFDAGPDHYIPGTKMPMQRIAKQRDRSDLIDYLRTATAAEGN